MPNQYTGIYAAVVQDLADPTRQSRARLVVPSVLGRAMSAWATPVLGPNNVTRAKVGDRVWVLFEHGDLNKPTWLGNIDKTPTGVIPGEIKMWPSAVRPDGYLWLDNGEHPIADYPELYNVLTDNGTVFPHGANTNGSGEAGSTHFRVPDGRGRSPLGVGLAVPAVAGGTTHTLGQKGGEELHTMQPAELATHTHIQNAHNHTQDAHNHLQNPHNHLQDPHSHATLINTALINARTAGGATYNVDAGGSAATALTTATNQPATATNQPATATNQPATATNQNTGSSTPFNVLNPYFGIYYIIKT